MEDALVLLNNLRQCRIEKKLSQGQLAEIVGVSRNTISSIETGQYSPTAKLAYSLCIVLDKKFEEVFYFEGYKAQTEAAKEETEDENFGLSNKAIHRIREYCASVGWSAEQILDFIIYVTK